MRFNFQRRLNDLSITTEYKTTTTSHREETRNISMYKWLVSLYDYVKHCDVSEMITKKNSTLDRVVCRKLGSIAYATGAGLVRLG